MLFLVVFCILNFDMGETFLHVRLIKDICEVLDVHVCERGVLHVHVGTRDLLNVGGRDLNISSRMYLMPMYVGTVLSYLMTM